MTNKKIMAISELHYVCGWLEGLSMAAEAQQWAIDHEGLGRQIKKIEEAIKTFQEEE